MTARAPDVSWIERPEVTLQVGQFHASREPCLITTVAGSCIALGLWGSRARVGGLTHFVVPPLDDAEEVTRFGAQAVDLLVCALIKQGADRLRLSARVVGADTGQATVRPVRSTRLLAELFRVERTPAVAASSYGDVTLF
jgi:chemotaxis protein CheD